MIYAGLIRPLLFRFDSETVHEWAVRIGEPTLPRVPGLARLLRVDDPVTLAGVRFPNRVGLAAGFDKNARFIRAAETLGFGHLEVGAVTPLAQPGHPRPRLFRVPGGSLRNRMGFNNEGAEAVIGRIPPRRRIVVGLNLGKGADTPLDGAAQDYLTVMQLAYDRVDYFSVNVSSPNTADLRELGRGVRLRELCEQLVRATDRQADQGKSRRSIWLKVSPDSTDAELSELAEVALATGVDGLIATNTTARREGRFRAQDRLGGLSGSALRERSLAVVALLRARVGPGFPLIGVGGVCDRGSALALRAAGADLVQVYTGFVYQGPALPSGLARAMKVDSQKY